MNQYSGLEKRKESFISRCSFDSNGCLIWRGYVSPKGGYGQSSLNGRNEWAHRVSWILHNGPIKDCLWVLHKCDVRACVNPRPSLSWNACRKYPRCGNQGKNGCWTSERIAYSTGKAFKRFRRRNVKANRRKNCDDDFRFNENEAKRCCEKIRSKPLCGSTHTEP